MVALGGYHRDVSLGASLDVRTLPAVVRLGLGIRPRGCVILSPGCDTVSSTAVVSLFWILREKKLDVGKRDRARFDKRLLRPAAV